MTSIRFSEAEQRERRPSAQSVQRAVQAIEEDGFVVLEDVVDPAHIAAIRDRMLEDVPAILARTDTPFNFTRSNIQQDPPPFPPYLFRDVLCNEFAIAVTSAIMGANMQNDFYSGNTALPRTEQRQPVHADVGHLWPNMKTPTPPYALVVNLPMVDMSVDNGSTEIWPGTHWDTSVAIQEGDIKVSEEKLAARREVCPPIQPAVRAGSILIRDIRLWHAGMPNPSDQPRPMVAMIHWVGWWHLWGKVKFHPAAKELLEHPNLRWSAEFVEGEIGYVMNNQAYDMVER